MARRRHLKNAPIVEAIVDFRVKLPAKFKVQTFASIKEILGDSYPQMEERREFEAGIKIQGKRVEHIVEEKGLQGYFFKSSDGKNVAQFRKDGFTFSRLKPYTNWQDVSAEAKKLWRIYVDSTFPDIVVTRIAARYINQLDIPLPIKDLEKYLKAPPAIPQNAPQELHQFLTRVTIRDPKFDIMAHIIQALERSSKRDCATVILDIDVFKQKESGFVELEIWQTFKQLRDLKNRIFFDSITEKTARLFE